MRTEGNLLPDPANEGREGPVPQSAIADAARRIRLYVRWTPVLQLDADLGVDKPQLLTLKLDMLQPSGSFKVRNAFSVLTAHRAHAGAIAASGGIFGIAMAHAARALSVPLTVFVPRSSPPAKINAVRRYGVRVEVVDGYYPEALAAAENRAAETGVKVVHGYDDPDVIAGAGTCGAELDLQAPELDTVLVAVGGGGLIAGIASWYAGRIRILGVETERTQTMHAAFAVGRPVDVEVGGIAASALGARRVGDLPWKVARRWVDAVHLVTDDDLLRAQRWLWETARLLAEPAAAAPLAALMTGAYRPEPGERVGLIVCGANVDPRSFAG